MTSEQQPAAPTQPRTAAGRALFEAEYEPGKASLLPFILAIEAEAARINVTHVNAPPIQPLDEARAAGSGGLDVERLAAALRAAGLWPQYPQENRAKRIAAEYARLQPPAEPTDLDLLEGKQPNET